MIPVDPTHIIQEWMWSNHVHIFIPKWCPRGGIFFYPIPPYFGREDLIIYFRIPNTKTSFPLGKSNCFLIDQVPFMLISFPSLEEIALEIEAKFEDPFRGNQYWKQVEGLRLQNRFDKGESTSKL